MLQRHRLHSQDDETGLPCVEKEETGKKTKISSESKQKPRIEPFNRQQEAFEKVAKDEARKLSTVQLGAVTAKERVVVRGNRSGKEVWQVF